MPLTSNLLILLITGVLTLVGNFVGFKVNPLEAAPGVLILIVIAFVGIALSKVVPVKIPSVAYIVTLSTILTIPGRIYFYLHSKSKFLGTVYTYTCLCRNIYREKFRDFEENWMENFYLSSICNVRNIFRFCHHCTNNFKNARSNIN